MIRFDPLRALRVLNDHQVRYIVIGGLAAGLWGSPSATYDLDICYDRSPANREALVRALRALEATLRGAPENLPFQLDARTIAMGDSFTFSTIAGAVDCLGIPAGTSGYADLAKSASEMAFDDVRVLVASLDDIVRMKRAAGRPRDLAEIAILTAVKEERERG